MRDAGERVPSELAADEVEEDLQRRGVADVLPLRPAPLADDLAVRAARHEVRRAVALDLLELATHLERELRTVREEDPEADRRRARVEDQDPVGHAPPREPARMLGPRAVGRKEVSRRAALAREHGAPARLYSAVKLGYKMVKYVLYVNFLPERTGGYWEDQGYERFAGV